MDSAPELIDLGALAKAKAEARARSMKNLKRYEKGMPSANPGGKPKNARNRLQGGFLNALADDFDKHGREAIKRARRLDPMGYVKAIVALMPKQFEQTTPLEDMSDAELYAGIDFLRSKLAISIDQGNRAAGVIEPAEIVPALPEAIRIP